MMKVSRALGTLVSCASALSFVIAMAGCGGSAEVTQTAATGPAEPGSLNARATASGPVVLRILAQPTGATVASGSGVSFTVSAEAATNGGPLRYRWTGPNGLISSATTATLSIAAATASDVGNYAVTVSDRTGWINSNKVPLSVVSAAWAQIGGRELATSPASQQPSLALCGQPTVAWIETGPPGATGRLNVWRFSGTAWTKLGVGVLNQSSAANAAEPTLDCVDGQPVVAWTEGAGAARNVYIKRWNGSAWVAVGGAGIALNQNVGSTASKPVLRVNYVLPTTDPIRPTIGQLPQYSALAWIEDGQAKAKFWTGSGWQFYIGGTGPGGNGVTEIALTLDIEEPTKVSPPVIAMNVPLPASRRTVSASTNRGGWRAIGASPSPPIPNATALALGGIGMGLDRGGRLPIAAWITGSANYSMDSTRFASVDFTDTQLGLITPTPTWSTYALSVTDGNLKAASFDPREFRITCTGERVPTFGYAIGNSSGFSVLRGQCNNAPLSWERVVPRFSGVMEALSLRMASESDPVVAGVQLVAGQYRLSVWRYSP